jgi:ribosomal protein S18 acetylase RimI-like enzyme
MKTCYTTRLGSTALAIADLVAPGETANHWVVTRINVPRDYRGQGYARQLLQQILDDADSEQVTLAVEVSPSDGLNFGSLVAWYRRYGFKSTAFGYMVRKPKPLGG